MPCLYLAPVTYGSLRLFKGVELLGGFTPLHIWQLRWVAGRGKALKQLLGAGAAVDALNKRYGTNTSSPAAPLWICGLSLQACWTGTSART
jgi:hypothetical protein